MRKICIIQIENFHTEVVIPQIEALKNNFELYTYTPQCLQGIEDFQNSSDITCKYTPLSSNPDLLFRASKIVWIRNFLFFLSLLKLRWLNSKYKFGFLIFTTVTNTLKGQMIGVLFKRTSKVRIIHHVTKQSLQCNGIFDKNIVLSKAIYDNAELEHTPKMAYYEPVHFSGIISSDSIQRTISEPVRIGVIGKTDYTKRNYKDLFHILEKFKVHENKVKIFIIGETDNILINELDRRGISKLVEFTYGYISFQRMLEIVKTLDAVAYLIDPKVDQFELYNVVKISGASNLVKFFNIPIIVHKQFRCEEFLEPLAIKYDESIEEVLLDIQRGKLTQDIIFKMRYSKKEHERYLESEKQRLIEIINDI